MEFPNIPPISEWSKGVKIYFAFLLLIGLALIGVQIAESDWQKDYQDLLKEYNVDQSKGELLIECKDGTHEKFSPGMKFICGEPISEPTTTTNQEPDLTLDDLVFN